MIWRTLEFSEMEEAAHGLLPIFHGFIWQPRGESDRGLAEEIREGEGTPRKALAYFNVLNAPCAEWDAPYAAFTRTLPVIPGATFPWFRCTGGLGRGILAWHEITLIQMRDMAELMNDLALPGTGAFLDQFWLEPKWWMFSEEGTPFSALGPEQIARWRTNITLFRDVFLAPRFWRVYTNGEWSDYRYLYLENSQTNWDEALRLANAAPAQSILSVDARFLSYLPELGRRVGRLNVALASPEQGAVRQGYILLEEYQLAIDLPA